MVGLLCVAALSAPLEIAVVTGAGLGIDPAPVAAPGWAADAEGTLGYGANAGLNLSWDFALGKAGDLGLEGAALYRFESATFENAEGLATRMELSGHRLVFPVLLRWTEPWSRRFSLASGLQFGWQFAAEAETTSGFAPDERDEGWAGRAVDLGLHAGFTLDQAIQLAWRPLASFGGTDLGLALRYALSHHVLLEDDWFDLWNIEDRRRDRSFQHTLDLELIVAWSL